MQKLLSILCGIFLGLAVTGCATVEDPSLKFGLGTLDDDTLRQQFKDEWALRGGNQPTLGLALSGGGTKAGVFAHGVLHGLHDTGLLKEVDVISTVSGGGYAAYWYYSKLMQAQELGFDPGTIFQDCFPSWWDNPNEKPTPNQLHLKKVFDAGRAHARATKQFNCESSSHATKEQPGDPFRWQAHLLRWPDVFRTQPIAVTGNAQTSPTMDFLGQFASLVFELTVGWTGIESNLPRSYQQGLERTWGLNPAPRNIDAAQKKDAIESGKWTYTNALPLVLPQNRRELTLKACGGTSCKRSTKPKAHHRYGS